ALECANSGGLVLDGRLDLLKAALRMLPVQATCTLATRCDAPRGSGLGASGAMDVALVAALALARGERLAEREIAEQGWYLEAVDPAAGRQAGSVRRRPGRVPSAQLSRSRRGRRADHA